MNRDYAIHGDIIAIPIAGSWVLGRVVFVSSVFKDIMQVDLRGPFEDYTGEWEAGQKLCVLFTASAKFSRKGWRIVDEGKIKSDDLLSSRRLVVGALWEGDVKIKEVAPCDRGSYRMMNVDGFGMVESILIKKVEQSRNLNGPPG